MISMHPNLAENAQSLSQADLTFFFGWHSQSPASNVVKLQKKSGKVFYSLVNHELLPLAQPFFRSAGCAPFNAILLFFCTLSTKDRLPKYICLSFTKLASQICLRFSTKIVPKGAKTRG